jgi:hypothetical protein
LCEAHYARWKRYGITPGPVGLCLAVVEQAARDNDTAFLDSIRAELDGYRNGVVRHRVGGDQ